ncbi:hypothetical protein M8C13_30055 [Crossiella sp. SN42]|uniref:hypothetical protein n=1 Tax=Crossiella sp. SN42 TaxID=2944808 RepID=UPI00207D36B1|nr:hypothetical protein [Crossiella sp. SN42]MCO1580005.1 hypothetical protein [Crossiella sp. SN42]
MNPGPPAPPVAWVFVRGASETRQHWTGVSVLLALVGGCSLVAGLAMLLEASPAIGSLGGMWKWALPVFPVGPLWPVVFLVWARRLVVRDHVDLARMRRCRRAAAVGSWTIGGLAALAVVPAVVVPWIAGGAFHVLLILPVPMLYLCWVCASLPLDMVRKLEGQVEQAVRAGWGPPRLI